MFTVDGGATVLCPYIFYSVVVTVHGSCHGDPLGQSKIFGIFLLLDFAYPLQCGYNKRTSTTVQHTCGRVVAYCVYSRSRGDK